MTGFFSSIVRDSRGGNTSHQGTAVSGTAGKSTVVAGGPTAANASFRAAGDDNQASIGPDRTTPADNAGNTGFPVAADATLPATASVTVPITAPATVPAIPVSAPAAIDAMPEATRQQQPGIQGVGNLTTGDAVAEFDNSAASGSSLDPPSAPLPKAALQSTQGGGDIDPVNGRQAEPVVKAAVARTTVAGTTAGTKGETARVQAAVNTHPADVADNLATTTEGDIGEPLMTVPVATVPVATMPVTTEPGSPAIGNDGQSEPAVPSPVQHLYQAVIKPPPARPGTAGADNNVTGPASYSGDAGRKPPPGTGLTGSNSRPQIKIGQVNVVVEGPPAAPGKKSAAPVDQASRLLLRGF